MNLFTSFMRSVTPMAAGLVLGLLAKVGLHIESATVTVYTTAGLTAGYYAIFRLLEHGAARIGWAPVRKIAGAFLGWARPPEYRPATVGDVRVHLDWDKFGEELYEIIRRNIRASGTGRLE